MLGTIAAFEFRYQVKSPLFMAAAAALFLAAFCDMSVGKLVTSGGGNVLYNSPHSIIMSHVLVSLVFLFVGAAFVANVIVRDDLTGFGPLIRSTRVSKADYLFGRFLGAFGVGALVIAAVPFGAWLGTLMPFADQDMLGPNRLSGFVYGFGLIALPNALIISAFLFALATATRSTAGTFVGVVGILFLYLFSQRLMEGEAEFLNLRVLADPLGATAYLATSRYFTAAELNAGVVPFTDLMLLSRLLWVAASLAVLALTYHRFQFAERGISRRQRSKRDQEAALHVPPTASNTGLPFARLPDPRFSTRTAVGQFIARASMEARFIFRSPVFWILLLMAFGFAFPSLLTSSGGFGVPLYPLTANIIPTIEVIFDTVLVIIATYYGGELVWRERERNMHQIIDATPLAAWCLMFPKMLGLSLVLFTTLLIGVAVGLLVQLLDGRVDLAPGEYLLWYLLPGALDALLLAVLAVFVQALSPSKYAGWGIMVVYIILSIFGPSMGLEYPLILYGNVPGAPLSDMVGAGNYLAAAWWFRLFWAAVAVVLLVGTHLIWPRGTEQPLKSRLGQVRARMTGRARKVIKSATVAVVLAGAWIVYNTLFLNNFRASGETEQHLAEYEKRYFRYASLPQPTVRHVELNVALFPGDARAHIRGRYRLVNETEFPIDRVHVRLMNQDLKLVAMELPGARLERNDPDFDYRIYSLDRAMRPGEERSLTFTTLRVLSGFRASGTEAGIVPDGVDLDSLKLTPRIGMSDVGMIEEPALRRKYGLPERQPFPRLDDMAATRITPSGDAGWTTADITVSTPADQVSMAPGKKVSERVRDGRRIARFVSDAPVKNFFLVQSARYAIRKQNHRGVEYEVYFHPAHHWNVDRMMTAMQTSIDYYGRAFGPYQFDQMRIVERPMASGGQAFPNTIAVGEGIFSMDLRDSETLDMVSLLTAHEVAHQWWGHQVLGARMQGGSMLYETLSQYSALMVMKKLQGEHKLRPFFQFQLDRYLSGRRTEVLEEQPLISAGIEQDHINYGKGAIAMYLLQKRMGEKAVNRALRNFIDRYRFTVAPYPRSLDLIRMLRNEATTAYQQALITDLFERITLYDLRVDQPTAVKRADGRWDVTVPVVARKLYADARGNERPAMLNEPIEIGLLTDEPNSSNFDQSKVVTVELRPIRSGRQVHRFVTDRRPTFAGIDPYNLYIDRNASDNIGSVTS